jgi:hypothetical protein
MKSFYYVVMMVFVSFFLFTACGGEDCVSAECFKPADEISVTDDDEVADETTDETVDEVVDEVMDEENPDEDQGVTANCEKLLDIVGDWVRIDLEGYELTLTVTPRETDCEVKLNWKKGFNGIEKWYGLELPLTYWHTEGYRFMTLKKVGENLIREETQENGDFIGDLTLKKIQ